jgi:hypothetical protein
MFTNSLRFEGRDVGDGGAAKEGHLLVPGSLAEFVRRAGSVIRASALAEHTARFDDRIIQGETEVEQSDFLLWTSQCDTAGMTAACSHEPLAGKPIDDLGEVGLRDLAQFRDRANQHRLTAPRGDAAQRRRGISNSLTQHDLTETIIDHKLPKEDSHVNY